MYILTYWTCLLLAINHGGQSTVMYLDPAPAYTFYDAEVQCQSRGMELAILNSQAAYDEAVAFIESNNQGLSEVWIGYKLTDVATAVFEWINGETTQFEVWARSNPDNIAPDSCVRLSLRGKAYLFDDNPCSTPNCAFLCTEINLCISLTNACNGHGQCIHTVGSYQCICVTGWTGQNCSIDINECISLVNICKGHGQCVNTVGSYKCVCDTGWGGQNCSVVQTIGMYLEPALAYMFYEAVDGCKQRGMQLAILNSQAVYDEAVEYITSQNPGVTNVWIGFKIMDVANASFGWINGETTKFVLWKINNPDYIIADSCVRLKLIEDNTYGFADNPCLSYYAFLCTEIKENTTTEVVDTTTIGTKTTTAVIGTTTESIDEVVNTTTYETKTATEVLDTATEGIETTIEFVDTTTEVTETTKDVVDTTTVGPETMTEIFVTTAGTKTTFEVVDITTVGTISTTEVVDTTTEEPETTTEIADTTTVGTETATDMADTTTVGTETATDISDTTTVGTKTTTEVVDTTTEGSETTTGVVDTTSVGTEFVGSTSIRTEVTIEVVSTTTGEIETTTKVFDTTTEGTETTIKVVENTTVGTETATAVDTPNMGTESATEVFYTTTVGTETMTEAMDTAEVVYANVTAQILETTAMSGTNMTTAISSTSSIDTSNKAILTSEAPEHTATGTIETATVKVFSKRDNGTIAGFMCNCCNVELMKKYTNYTFEELKQTLSPITDHIRKNLLVDKQTLSAYIYKRKTREDNRPSARYLGYVGVTFLVAVGVLIILADISSWYTNQGHEIEM